MNRFHLIALLISAPAADACTVFSEIPSGDWSCESGYLEYQFQGSGLTLTQDPTTADFAIGYYHSREQGSTGHTDRTYLAGFSQRDAGAEVCRAEMDAQFVPAPPPRPRRVREPRQRQYQQQQQQQQMSVERCKERRYHKRQGGLAQLIPLLQQECAALRRR